MEEELVLLYMKWTEVLTDITYTYLQIQDAQPIITWANREGVIAFTVGCSSATLAPQESKRRYQQIYEISVV